MGHKFKEMSEQQKRSDFCEGNEQLMDQNEWWGRVEFGETKP